MRSQSLALLGPGPNLRSPIVWAALSVVGASGSNFYMCKRANVSTPFHLLT